MQIYKKQIVLSMALLLWASQSLAQWNFSTDYFKIHIDKKGFITSMKNITVNSNREFCQTDQPSPLMLLYDGSKKIYYEPVNASYHNLKTY